MGRSVTDRCHGRCGDDERIGLIHGDENQHKLVQPKINIGTIWDRANLSRSLDISHWANPTGNPAQ